VEVQRPWEAIGWALGVAGELCREIMKAVKDRKPHIRPGQAAFNALLKLRPEIAEQIRGGPLDPFHHDEPVAAEAQDRRCSPEAPRLPPPAARGGR
jgi:hypothetical protein